MSLCVCLPNKEKMDNDRPVSKFSRSALKSALRSSGDVAQLLNVAVQLKAAAPHAPVMTKADSI